MSKRTDESQQRLKVITTIDDSPEKEHIDPTGQVLLFNTQKVLVPPGFEAFADFMNNRLYQTQKSLEASTEQSRRLANSLETVIPKFIEQSVDHTNPDIVFGHLTAGEQADVAIADGTDIPAEVLYPLSAGDIAQQVGNNKMSASQMGITLRKLKIYGNPRFHHPKKHGNSVLQCYKPTVIDEIYKRVADPKTHGLDATEVAKIVNRLKPREALN